MTLAPPYSLKRVGLVLMGAGVLLCCVALPPYFEARQSAHWPQTRGIITNSRVEATYSTRFRENFYHGVVGYDYSVAGVPFHGSRYSFNKVHYGTLGNWQRIVDSYPVGKEAAVYYDPKNPASAVLEPGLFGEMHDLFILSFILIGFFSAGFLGILFAT